MAFLYPLSLLRDRRRARRFGSILLSESRKSRRRRIWQGTISLFCLPLMLLGADTVYALAQDAALYRSIIAIAATGPVACEGAASCIAYEWDDNGNMISRTQSFGIGGADKIDTHRYDVENRLIHIERNIDVSTPQIADYRYAPDGLRRWKSAGATETSYLIDRNQPYAQVLEETRLDAAAPIESVVVTTYVYGDDLISRARTADEEVDDGQGGTQVVSATHRRYYHYDGQLSTRHLTDEGAGATPQVTDEYTYDAFGVMLHKDGLTPAGESENAYLYTGEQYDALAGMYYLRARYYAQQQGRFATMDPFGGYSSDPMSLHKYLYANANPVMNWDPSGLISRLRLIVALVIILLIVAVAFYAYQAAAPAIGVVRANASSSKLDDEDPRAKDDIARILTTEMWPGNPRAVMCARSISGSSVDGSQGTHTIFLIESNKYVDGMHIRGPAKDLELYVPRDAYDSYVAGTDRYALPFFVFVEWQHYQAGGSMGEQAAQDEMEPMRCSLPPSWRSQRIMDVHHWETENHGCD